MLQNLFGLFVTAGFWAGIIVVYIRANLYKNDFNCLLFLFLIVVIIGLIFGKLWELLFNIQAMISIKTDFSIIGSIYGFILLIILVIKFKKNKLLYYLDLITPSLPIFQSIGKLGCYSAGCCYGVYCDCFLSIENKFPVQIFESFFLFVIFLILYNIRLDKQRLGIITYLYLIFYGIERFISEFLRNDSAKDFYVFSIYQIGAFGIFFIGLIFYKSLFKKN